MDTIEYHPPLKSPYKLIPMSKASADKLLEDKASVVVKSGSPNQKSSTPEVKCSRCQSQCIVTGSVSDSRRGRCFFAPSALKFWTITKSYGKKVESYACINCGLIWMQTSPKMLEDFVRNYCEQKDLSSSAFIENVLIIEYNKQRQSPYQ